MTFLLSILLRKQKSSHHLHLHQCYCELSFALLKAIPIELVH